MTMTCSSIHNHNNRMKLRYGLGIEQEQDEDQKVDDSKDQPSSNNFECVMEILSTSVTSVTQRAAVSNDENDIYIRSVDGQAARYRRDKKTGLQSIKMSSTEKAEALKSAAVPKSICATSMAPLTVVQRTGTSDVVDVANARTTAPPIIFADFRAIPTSEKPQ